MRLALGLLLAIVANAAGQMETVFRAQKAGGERYLTPKQMDFAGQNLAAAFRAIITNIWQPGLVPVFLVERNGQFELRRLPPRGQENITEPFFFALAAEGDASATAIAGRWKCEAKRGDGVVAYADFEVAVQGTNVAARFDQNTEYRFAFITKGSFVLNRLELRIEYIADHYIMTGMLENGRLTGTWRHTEDKESGAWHAERDLPTFATSAVATDLYEWKSANGSVQYRLAGEAVPGAIRADRPVCRVWPLK